MTLGDSSFFFCACSWKMSSRCELLECSCCTSLYCPDCPSDSQRLHWYKKICLRGAINRWTMVSLMFKYTSEATEMSHYSRPVRHRYQSCMFCSVSNLSLHWIKMWRSFLIVASKLDMLRILFFMLKCLIYLFKSSQYISCLTTFMHILLTFKWKIPMQMWYTKYMCHTCQGQWCSPHPWRYLRVI